MLLMWTGLGRCIFPQKKKEVWPTLQVSLVLIFVVKI